MWRWRICDSETVKERKAISSRAEWVRRQRWRGERRKKGETNKKRREWVQVERFISMRALHFRTCCVHQCGLTLGSTEGDEMAVWTEWIINVKIFFSAESNKLPMIWLSERLVGWIRETLGSHGAMSSPPWVIDSCTVSTFWSWWLREPGPDWSPESGSSGWVAGPHSKPIQGDLCPECRAVVNPQLSDLKNTDHCIDVEQWMLRAAEGPAGLVFLLLLCCFLLLPFSVFLTLSVTMWLLQGSQASKTTCWVRKKHKKLSSVWVRW